MSVEHNVGNASYLVWAEFMLPDGRRGHRARSQVVFPVPRGPKRKNVYFGTGNRRVNVASIFAVKMLADNAMIIDEKLSC
jgi:hypothetical protein